MWDRTKAIQLGLTQRDVASSLLTSLSSSFQTSPSYWMNPKNGVNYLVAVQTPTYKINSIDDVANLPITTNKLNKPELLSNLAKIGRSTTSALISHSGIQPVFDIYLNTQDRDLGGVTQDVRKIVADFQKQAPRGTFVLVRGQADAMNAAF